MNYSVDYMLDNEMAINYFVFEHEAKHFAVDIAYEGFNPVICEFGKIIGKIETFGNCKAFVYI
ncbi:MAG: hypothetical protein RLY40_1006 [Pseudomonadota bacterium]|jgi:hypothetical protein